MGVSQDHSEFISDWDTGEHVSDGAANGAKDSVSLLFLKPHSELEGAGFGLLALFFSDFNRDVFESSSKSSELAFYDYLSGFDVNSDSFRDFELLLSNDELHGYGD